MDLALAIAALLAFMTNALGVNDQTVVAFRAARDFGKDKYQDLRIWLGTTIAGPLSTFMFVCAFGLLCIFGLATWVHFSVLTLAEREKGVYFSFTLVTLASIAAITIWAFFQRRYGKEKYQLGPDGEPVEEVIEEGGTEVRIKLPHPDYKPKRVAFFLSGFVLTSGMASMSITLLLHTVYTGSRALALISMVTWYLGLVVIAAVFGVLSWLVDKGVGMFERVLQAIVEPLASLLPGITLKNVTAKLFPGGLDILNQQKLAAKIAAATSVIAVITLPFHLLVFLYPTVTTAVVVGGAYVFSLFAGFALRAVGRGDIVDESRDRLLKILFTWGKWVMLLILLPSGMFLSSELSNGLKARGQIASSGFSDFLQGRAYLVDNHSFWLSILLLIVFVIITMGMIGAASHWDSKKWKVIGVGIPALVVAWCAIAIKVRASDQQGWTPFSPNVAQTDAQQIGVNNLQSKVTDTSVLLTWETGKDARCRVEIKEIRDRNGRPVDRATGIPLVVFDPSEEPKKPSEINEEMQEQATAALGKRVFLEAVSLEDGHIKHRVAINNLAYGWTVVYRVWTKHIADPDTGMWPDQDPPWHNVSVIAPASAPAAAPSTAPKTAPSNVPAAQSAPPKDRPAAATNSGASQKLADSRRLLEGL